MRNVLGTAGVFGLVCAGVFGQQFEVATVKLNQPLPGGGIRVMMRGGPGTNDPGRVNFEGLTLKDLLSRAYTVKRFQVSGPGWVDTERYDIAAKVPDGTSKEQFNVMLQNLLAERFQVAFHREKKEFPVYDLSVAKNGPKLTPSVEDPNAPQPGPPGPPPPGRGGMPQLPPGRPNMGMMIGRGVARVAARVQPITSLVDVLANQLNSQVVDKTGLAATYDFTLEFVPEAGLIGGLGPPPPPPPGADAGGPRSVGSEVQNDLPDLFTALQQQLGLKLDKSRGMLDVLVIDRAEKNPSEN